MAEYIYLFSTGSHIFRRSYDKTLYQRVHSDVYAYVYANVYAYFFNLHNFDINVTTYYHQLKIQKRNFVSGT